MNRKSIYFIRVVNMKRTEHLFIPYDLSVIVPLLIGLKKNFFNFLGYNKYKIKILFYEQLPRIVILNKCFSTYKLG